MMGPFSDGRERPTRGTDLDREIQKDIIDLRNIIMEMTSADAEFSRPFRYILLQFIITIVHYFYGRHDITLCVSLGGGIQSSRLCTDPQCISRAVRSPLT